MGFKDHFSEHAQAYRRFRPGYPDALFRYLSELSPDLDRAWDCGTGNGQAAVALAAHFREVIATDASAEQLAHAGGPVNVRFDVAGAEASGLAAASVDLITVAQAFHWFDQPRFFAEAERVLRGGGILAIWTYGVMHVDPVVDALIQRFYRDIVGPYWPPERAQVDAGYADARLPFPELEVPYFEMSAQWPLEAVLGYLRTWSATQRYIRERGEDPTEGLRRALTRAWPQTDVPRTVTWPLQVRVARKPAVETGRPLQ